MKKFLGILGTIITAGSGTLTLVANSPSSIKTEEKILKRTKRWGEVQWIQITQQWRNAELTYQREANDFQRTQNHWQFSQAQQRFLQAQQSFNNSKNEWQQGLTQWANQIRQERNQQWWNNNNSSQAHEAERQWVYYQANQLANKVGTTIDTHKINQILQEKWNKRQKRKWGNDDCTMGMASGAALAGIGAIWIPFLGAIAAIYGLISVACSVY